MPNGFGGMLGLAASGYLNSLFNIFGSAILLTATLLASLIITTGLSWVRILQLSGAKMFELAGVLGQLVTKFLDKFWQQVFAGCAKVYQYFKCSPSKSLSAVKRQARPKAEKPKNCYGAQS